MAQAQVGEHAVEIRTLGTARLPADPSRPWPLPRRIEQMAIAEALPLMSDGLADWGYRVRTGPTDAPRVQARLATYPAPGHVPLIWAEMIGPVRGGVEGLSWPSSRHGRPAWFDSCGEDRHLVRQPVLLLQRTTAPEQPRRLVGSLLSAESLARHGPVAVAKHVNLVEPLGPEPAVDLPTLVPYFGSAAADAAIRCTSGSVNVSAYELASLPLPPAAALEPLTRMVAGGAPWAEIEAACWRICRVEPSGSPADRPGQAPASDAGLEEPTAGPVVDATPGHAELAGAADPAPVPTFGSIRSHPSIRRRTIDASLPDDAMCACTANAAFMRTDAGCPPRLPD